MCSLNPICNNKDCVCLEHEVRNGGNLTLEVTAYDYDALLIKLVKKHVKNVDGVEPTEAEAVQLLSNPRVKEQYSKLLGIVSIQKKTTSNG